MTSDTVNEIAREEQAYWKWERQEKNRILAIQNSKRKQEEWNKLFPPVKEPDDSYLEGNVF